VLVAKNILGNTNAANYAIFVSSMNEAFQNRVLSIKMHFLLSHIEKFSESLGAKTDE
jgi:hypothetical protein